ncbi:MAG: CHAP domain-containing protein [Chloroflexia bacterium]
MYKSIILRKLVLATMSITFIALGVGTSYAQTSGGRTNPYPYGTQQYWAWQNRPDLPANLGEPYAWNDNAGRQGWPVSDYPRRGDVAVFEPGVLGAHPKAGQVAFVEQVLVDGQYTVSLMDDKDCSACGRVDRRTYTLAGGTSFIHYQKDSRTTWGFQSGQSGWTATDLGAGNLGGPGWYYPLAGADPHLVSPALEIPLDYTYNTIEVDIVQGIPVKDSTIQVYFATAAQPNFTEANSVQIRGLADGELHRYSFYFAGNPNWKGNLIGLRLDPAGAGTQGGVRIDRVRLVHSESEPPTYTALSETPSNNHGGRRR